MRNFYYLPWKITLIITFLGVTACDQYDASTQQNSTDEYQKINSINKSTEKKARGIDVSHYQGTINWPKVKQNNSFVFIKASEGAQTVDKEFHQNVQGANQEGMLVGAYHFFDPDIAADKQAQHFIKTIDLQSLSLPPVLDVELQPKYENAQFLKNVRLWMTIIAKKTGCQPILYTNHAMWKQYFEKHMTEYPLWLSEYDTTLGHIKNIPWHYWQHTSNGKTEGINNLVDLSYYKSNQKSLIKQAACKFQTLQNKPSEIE